MKILKVCTRINEELTHPEKIIVICRLAEFLKANDTPEEMALDFAWTVADTFNISKDEFQLIYGLIFHRKDWLNHPQLVRIAAQQGEWEKALFLEKKLDSNQDYLHLIYLPSTDFFLMQFNSKESVKN